MTDPQILDALTAAYKKKKDRFSNWEAEFVVSVQGRSFLTDKQREIAERILSEKSATKQDAAAARADQWHAAAACGKCLDGLVILRIADNGSFHEQAFPCTCSRGELKQAWQGYPRSARDAWKAGWRTKQEWEAA